MKILLFKVGEEPAVIEVNNELEDLQELVGGYIEAVPVSNKYLLVCNEEGKLLNRCLPNKVVRWDGGTDIIHGDFFFCSECDGDFTSINENDIDELKTYVL